MIFSDFQQCGIGNCGLIAALAALSQRSEFLTEIAPTIYPTSDGIKLQFNMFCKGEPITVIIDDALPFDKNKSLVYANAKRKENLFLSSLFEKVFVKQACNYSYERCKGTRTNFAFSSFSKCLISYMSYKKEDTKRNFMDSLALEISDKSSVVLGIRPSLYKEHDAEVVAAHAYAVMDYNQENRAVKLYDPRCNPKQCVTNKNLPQFLTTDADPNKGELWVTMDQLENRVITVSSLHSKNMYESVFSIKRKISLSRLDRKKFVSLDTCKVIVEETSTFIVNFFSYSHLLRNLDLILTTTNDKKLNVNLNYELPQKWYINNSCSRQNIGEAKLEYFQKFKLQPNTYVFSLEFRLSKQDEYNIHNITLPNKEELNFLLKIGSVSKCTFEELDLKAKQMGKCTIL